MKFSALLLFTCMAIGTAGAMAPPNDNFAQAQALTLPSGHVNGTTAGATTEKGEPKSPSDDSDGDTIWYSFMPTVDGVITLDADPNYSGGGEVKVSLFEGTALKKLKFIADNSYTFGAATRVTLFQSVSAGKQYYLVFDTYSYEHLRTGTFGFNFAFETAGLFAFVDPPLNLNSQAAWTYLEGTDAEIVLTVGRLGGSTGTAEVNYSIGADSRLGGALSGTLHFDAGVTRQTIPLTLANDNILEGNLSVLAQLSQPTANAAISPRGSIYLQIQDDEGTAPNDLFANAQVISAVPSVTAVITPYPTGTATVEPGESPTDRESIWYKVQPTAFGLLTLSATTLDFNVYTGDSLSSLVYAPALGNFVPSSWSGIVEAGQTYYVEVDAFQNTSGSLSYTLAAQPSFLQFDTVNDASQFLFNTKKKPAKSVLTVDRIGDASGVATVHYATSGTNDANADAGDTSTTIAVANVDFVPAEGTLSFAAGQTSATFTVSILGHKKGVQKHINVVLDNPTNSGVTPGSTTRIYIADGAEPTFLGFYGTYFAGLIPQNNGGEGYLRLTIAKTGSSSVKLSLNGENYTGKGTDAAETSFTLKGPKGSAPLSLSLVNEPSLDGAYVATISDGATTVATCTLFELQSYSAKFPTPSAGVYSATLIPGNQAPSAFQSAGSLSMKVAPTGKCRIVGTLPDGTKFSAGGGLSIELLPRGDAADTTVRTCSFGIPLYEGKGVLDGSITIVPKGFPAEPPASGDGTIALRWARPALDGTAAFAAGVGGNVSQLEYATGGQLFGGTSLLLSIPGAGLNTPLAFTLEAKNRAVFTAGSAGLPKLTFNAATGLFSGSITPSGGGKPALFQGAVLSNVTSGAGSALVNGQAVAVSISQAP